MARPSSSQSMKPSTSYLEKFLNRDQSQSQMTPFNARNAGHGVRNRRQKHKTIFSVDAARLSRAQVETGPGESGDGVGIKKDSLPTARSSIYKGEKEITVVLQPTIMPKGGFGDADVKVAETPESEPIEQEVSIEKPPLLKSLNGYIGILAESDQNSAASRGSSGYEMPGTFNLTLQRGWSSKKTGKKFGKSIEIHNMTEFLHGYKVYSNSSASSKFDLSPPMGLIKPNRQISLEISTKPLDVSFDMKKYAHDQIEIKLFRYYCSDPDCQEEYFEKLEEQRPDLISTQSIHKIIFWESGNMSESDEWETESNDQEHTLAGPQDELQIDLCKLGQFPPLDEKPPSQLHKKIMDVRTQMLVMDVFLGEAVSVIQSLRRSQHLSNLMIIFLMSLAIIVGWVRSL